VREEIDHKLSIAQGASASMIVAGQRKGGGMRLFLIYPEGNFIEATEDTPFLQIGEHKYGKPILDRVVKPTTSIADAQKAVLSVDGFDAAVEPVGGDAAGPCGDRKGRPARHAQAADRGGDPAFRAMSEAWSTALRDGFARIEI
jgi:putative proteasome-type protease